ncbi:response regulator transcription factor [Fulvivirga sp. M361]|uniref:LytR/AlgR family response regulator transcription factor n=1 Tax=Fulvivirga sp. M361 TaxID=2594266 RepID=UPI001179ABBF|nr:LytTR family DNA-binding domain-containing protein [Fulvivirga sp. M361]TRX58443.1 response regulator transcription factor [Fulvivirga sp. M361]
MQNQIKCLIVEDVEASASYLSNILKTNFKNIEILACLKDVGTSIDAINDLKPNLIFMDIEINGGTAFDILKAVDTHDCEVIFTTSHGRYMEVAMEHYAFYFLLKPFDERKLIEVVDTYFMKSKTMFSLKKYEEFKRFFYDEKSRLLLDIGKEYVTIKLDEVILCEADANYTIFHMENKKNYMASNLLKYYDELLAPKGFFRANRSTLINLTNVASIKKDKTILMKNDSRVMVSVRNRSRLMTLIEHLS